MFVHLHVLNVHLYIPLDYARSLINICYGYFLYLYEYIHTYIHTLMHTRAEPPYPVQVRKEIKNEVSCPKLKLFLGMLLIHASVYTHIHTFTDTCIHIYIRAYVHIHIHIHIYVVHEKSRDI